MLVLGALVGEAARAGRDKLTLLTSHALSSFGDWAEQLIAESTGKQNTGIVPVVGEPLGPPQVYGDDRAFVVVELPQDPFGAALGRSGGGGLEPLVGQQPGDLLERGGVGLVVDGAADRADDRVEAEWPGETRNLVPSPRDVPSYDLKPEMSAVELAARFCGEVGGGYRFAIVNFANPDMVGHTGSISAVRTAVEAARSIGLEAEAAEARQVACC